jgi:hypothetical protein
MGQRIDAGIGGEAEGRRQGQLEVDDGGDRQAAEAGDQHFLVIGGVGDDAEARRLGAGAGRGRDADHGQRRPVGEVRHLVVANMTAARRQHRHRLGRVHRAAAAERHETIEAAAGEQPYAGLDHLAGRVGHRVGENVHRDAGAGENPDQPVDQSRLAHEGIAHDQRIPHAEALQESARLRDGAAADLHETRRMKGCRHPGPPRARLLQN